MNRFIIFFLKLFILQIFIYSFFTEWISSYINNANINFTEESFVFFFFFIPIFLFFIYFKTYKSKYIYQIKVINPLLVSIIFFILPIIYFFILLKYDILSRRIGTENIAVIYGDMAFIDKSIMKLYDQSQYIYLIICFFSLRLNKNFKYRSFFKLIFIFNLFILAGFSLFNSRTAILFFVLLILLFDKLFNTISKKVKYKSILIASTFFLLVSIIRYAPTLYLKGNSSINEIATTEILNRVNCSTFFTEVVNATDKKGFLYGKSFPNPFLSIAALLGDEKSKEKIRVAETGSKQYLLNNYLQNNNKDDCSCMVVDSYANFGIFGIFYSALTIIFLLLVIYFIGSSNIISSSQFSMLIILIFSIFFYESDGMSVILSFIKYLPAVLLFWLLKPILIFKNLNEH